MKVERVTKIIWGWTSYKIFKKGGSTGPQFSEGVAGKGGGSDPFQGEGLQFLHKNIYNKKSL